MAEFIRSSLLKDHTAATESKKIDLPVNPLSHLIITLDCYNVSDEATLAELIAFINSIEVSHLGRTVVDLQSEDLAGVQTYLLGAHPILTQKIADDNAARCLGLIVPFGRRLFDANECFPSTKKGELTLTLDTTVPATSADNGIINVEAVELYGASPSRYLKSVMQTVSAPGATGDNDIDLPIGNDIVALNIRMTTFPGTGSSTYGVDGVSILVDNREYGYSYARAECLVADMANRFNSMIMDIAAQGDVQPANTVWVDFDPNKDSEWLLKTQGKSSCKVRLDMGVDEATYISVLELVGV